MFWDPILLWSQGGRILQETQTWGETKYKIPLKKVGEEHLNRSSTFLTSWNLHTGTSTKHISKEHPVFSKEIVKTNWYTGKIYQSIDKKLLGFGDESPVLITRPVNSGAVQRKPFKMTQSSTWCKSASVQTSRQKNIKQTMTENPNKYEDLLSGSMTHVHDHVTCLRWAEWDDVWENVKLSEVHQPPWSVKINPLGRGINEGATWTVCAALPWSWSSFHGKTHSLPWKIPVREQLDTCSCLAD